MTTYYSTHDYHYIQRRLNELNCKAFRLQQPASPSTFKLVILMNKLITRLPSLLSPSPFRRPYMPNFFCHWRLFFVLFIVYLYVVVGHMYYEVPTSYALLNLVLWILRQNTITFTSILLSTTTLSTILHPPPHNFFSLPLSPWSHWLLAHKKVPHFDSLWSYDIAIEHIYL